MKVFIRGFAVFAVLCSAPAAFGSIIIDSFAITPAITIGGVPATIAGGTRATTVSVANVTVADNTPSPVTFNFGTGGNPNGRWFQFDYTFDSLVNLSTSGTNVITFNYLTNNLANLTNYTILFTAIPDPVMPSSVLTANLSKTTTLATASFATSGFTNQSNLSSIRSLSIRVTANSTGAANSATFSFQSGISAVPEPATMTLLGLTGIAGVIAHRRRRKAQLAA